MKPTFNYILNGLALSSLIFRTIDSNEVASEQDKVDIKYQIELLQKEKTNSKQALNEIREYVVKEKKFNDNQIEEYKKCIETNENGKFSDEEKENFNHCMTVNICINYKMKDLLQIIDKVLGGSDEKGN